MATREDLERAWTLGYNDDHSFEDEVILAILDDVELEAAYLAGRREEPLAIEGVG